MRNGEITSMALLTVRRGMMRLPSIATTIVDKDRASRVLRLFPRAEAHYTLGLRAFMEGFA